MVYRNLRSKKTQNTCEEMQMIMLFHNRKKKQKKRKKKKIQMSNLKTGPFSFNTTSENNVVQVVIYTGS